MVENRYQVFVVRLSTGDHAPIAEFATAAEVHWFLRVTPAPPGYFLCPGPESEIASRRQWILRGNW